MKTKNCIKTITQPNGTWERWITDEHSRPIRYETSSGFVETRMYSKTGLLLAVYNIDGFSIECTYDEHGNIMNVTSNPGNIISLLLTADETTDEQVDSYFDSYNRITKSIVHDDIIGDIVIDYVYY